MAEGLTGAWVAARYGIEPRRVEAMRRAGELIALRRDDEYVYPSWQFDARGPVAGIASVVAEARRAGLDNEELLRLLEGREGLTGGNRRLREALRDGDAGRVVDAIRSRSA